jgi:RNA polymerase sigma factor (sigma-70 family)
MTSTTELNTADEKPTVTEARLLYDEYLIKYPRPFSVLFTFDGGVAKWAVNKFRKNMDEVEQVCLIGVWKAALNYRKAYGSFSNYVPWYIRQEVQHLKQANHETLGSGCPPDRALDKPGVCYPARNLRQDPADIVEHHDTLEHLRKRVSKLEPKLKQCISLRFGLSNRDAQYISDISKETQVSQKTVKQRIQRGLRRLKMDMTG